MLSAGQHFLRSWRLMRAACTHTTLARAHRGQSFQLQTSQNRSRDISPTSSSLVLLYGFAGSHSLLSKYSQVYQERGFDVLSIPTYTLHALWPKISKPCAVTVTKTMASLSPKYDNILVHALSGGFFHYVECFTLWREQPSLCGDINSKVRGVVFDSLTEPDANSFARGLSLNAKTSLGRALVFRTTFTWLLVSKRHTLDFIEPRFRQLQETSFHSVPTLFVYSRDDTLADWRTLDRTVNNWRAKDEFSVDKLVLDESLHVRHLVTHPTEYLAALDTYLSKVDFK